MQAAGDVLKRATPPIPNSLRILVNFPLFWKMLIDMVKAGSGYSFNYEIFVPGADLRERASITDIVDIAMLPKAIGGDAVSIDKDGNEDETCTRGIEIPTLSQFLNSLEERL